MFRKPDVVVEADHQNRGTPYRTCSIAVYVDDLDTSQLDRIRFGLSRIVSSPEVSVLAKGNPTPVDKRRFVRLQMGYHGKQLEAEKIVEAVKSVL